MTVDAGGALQGMRVLDLSRVLAGPFCTMQLADMGAEIVKIENPDGGDDTRHFKPPEAGGEAHYFLAVNRNKRSIALDIRTSRGQEIIHRLAARSDVLIENFRVGVMKRFGLDYAAMRERHPHLIYCSVSAYGQVGPMSDRPGFDPVLQAESGMMAYTGEPGRDPLRHPLAIIDTFTALYATSAILGAYVARQRTGRGQHIDLALLDTAIAVQTNAAQAYLVSGEDPIKMGNSHPTAAPVGLFDTPTGPIYIAVGTQRLFRILCEKVLERPEMADDPRFADNAARQANRDALFAVLEAAFAAHPREAWLEKTRAAGLPVGAVRTVSEALRSPEAEARGMVTKVMHRTAGELELIGSPFNFSETPTRPPMPPPLLGQHSEELLRELLGMDPEEVESLRRDGVIPRKVDPASV